LSAWSALWIKSKTINDISEKKTTRSWWSGASIPGGRAEKRSKVKKEMVFLIEGAQLEAAKLGSQICLLNVDDHKGHLAKHGKDVSSYRPDSFISRC